MGYIAFERTLCDTLWAGLPERNTQSSHSARANKVQKSQRLSFSGVKFS